MQIWQKFIIVHPKKIKYPNNSLKRCTVSRILWKTPFDYELIFIDSMFMSGFGTIVAFAKKQNIKTVGEFVENEAIFNILNEIGVDYSQGYYFGKPISLKII